VTQKESTPIDFVMHSVPNGSYKIDDVIVLDGSMINTYRCTFRKVISKNGIDGLVQKMRDKLSKKD
jgi:ABC-type transporter MlaC component